VVRKLDALPFSGLPNHQKEKNCSDQRAFGIGVIVSGFQVAWLQRFLVPQRFKSVTEEADQWAFMWRAIHTEIRNFYLLPLENKNISTPLSFSDENIYELSENGLL